MVDIAVVAPQEAIIGARNDAIAFTNWPKVRVEANLDGDMRLLTRGLSEVCIRALPMPKSEKAASIT